MNSDAGHSLRVLVPVAPRRTHVLAAGLVWTLVGTGLAFSGGLWIAGPRSRWTWPAILFSAGLGWSKSRLVLDRAARKSIRRIDERGDGRCIGGFMSWRSWILMAGMILLGRLLRASPLPVIWRGFIYAAIGFALFLSSRLFWKKWRRGFSAAPAGEPGSDAVLPDEE